MMTIEQEPIFTLHINGHKLTGFTLASEWEGFKKFVKPANGQVVIVATSKAQSAFHTFTSSALKGIFSNKDTQAEYVPLAASPELHDVLKLTPDLKEQKPAAAWPAFTQEECHDLTAMVYGAPWADASCAELVEVLSKYEELRATNQRPIDPARS